MTESRAYAGPLVLSGVVVGGLFEQVHGVVVEVALGVAETGKRMLVAIAEKSTVTT